MTVATKETGIEVKVGALVVACLLLLVGFQFLLGDFRLGERKTVTVDFDTSAALKEGAQVKVAGLDAGRVEKVEFRGGQVDPAVGRPVWVRVTLSIKPELAETLRSDATFYITTLGLLGEKYVEVDPGRAAEPLGDAIKLGTPPMRLEVMAANLNVFLAQGARLLRDNEKLVNETIVDVREAARSGRLALEEGRALIADTRKKLDAIADKGLAVMETADASLKEYTPGKGATGDTVKQVLDRGAHLVGTIDDTLGDGSELKATVADVRQIAAKTRVVIDQVGGKAVSFITKAEGMVDSAAELVRDGKGEVLAVLTKAKGLLDGATVVMAQLKDGQGTIGTLLHDREMYDDIREMMKDLKRHPWKFLWKE